MVGRFLYLPFGVDEKSDDFAPNVGVIDWYSLRYMIANVPRLHPLLSCGMAQKVLTEGENGRGTRPKSGIQHVVLGAHPQSYSEKTDGK